MTRPQVPSTPRWPIALCSPGWPGHILSETPGFSSSCVTSQGRDSGILLGSTPHLCPNPIPGTPMHERAQQGPLTKAAGTSAPLGQNARQALLHDGGGLCPSPLLPQMSTCILAPDTPSEQRWRPHLHPATPHSLPEQTSQTRSTQGSAGHHLSWWQQTDTRSRSLFVRGRAHAGPLPQQTQRGQKHPTGGGGSKVRPRDKALCRPHSSCFGAYVQIANAPAMMLREMHRQTWRNADGETATARLDFPPVCLQHPERDWLRHAQKRLQNGKVAPLRE